jgi:hypothetical protein
MTHTHAHRAAAERCGHFHETTSRYDRGLRQLSFLMYCTPCGLERVVETHDYEPRFEPSASG